MRPAIKVGLSTASVYPLKTEAAFEAAAELGYDGVELMVWAEPVSQDIGAISQMSRRYGMPVLSVHAPCLLISQRVWGPDPVQKLDRSVQAVFFLGSAIAAFGGIMVAILYNAVYTSMGDVVAYKGLALIVIGGFGSMTGAVIAAFLLGLTETALTTYTQIPLSRDGIAMLMLVILILVRPQGLLGRE